MNISLSDLDKLLKARKKPLFIEVQNWEDDEETMAKIIKEN